MNITAKIDYRINDKIYIRVVDSNGIISWQWQHEWIPNEVCPPHQQTKLETMFLEEVVYKAAAKHAGLPYPFDRGDEEYYNKRLIDVYDAYIAGYMLNDNHRYSIPVLVYDYVGDEHVSYREDKPNQ